LIEKQKAIVVENLSFTYDNTSIPAIKNISFTLHAGEVLGIIGPTGAGKTTLAMCLNALIPHIIPGKMEGKVWIQGEDISQYDVAEMSRTVGFVFQEPENQLSQMTVEEEVAFGMGNLGVPREEMRERIEAALAAVGLSGFEKRSPLALSGGQQQRLAIASVLAMKPTIMIMDEPTSMLDPFGKNEVYDVLKRLKSANMTGVIIDHEVERIAAYCDKILLLHQQEMVKFGTPKELFLDFELLTRSRIKAPQVTEFTRQLNQDLKMNYDYPVTLEEAIKIYS
jgi:energy-coupling factor transport system ATP-binding protein